MTHYVSSASNFSSSGSASDRPATNYGAKKSDEADKWAKIWFKQLCRFHRCSPARGWQFSLDQVIQFLKSRVTKGEPAWKRLKAVEALIRFQKNLPEEQRTDLTFVRVKLQERAAFEKTQSKASGNGGSNDSEPRRDESRREKSRRDESSENESSSEKTPEAKISILTNDRLQCFAARTRKAG